MVQKVWIEYGRANSVSNQGRIRILGETTKQNEKQETKLKIKTDPQSSKIDLFYVTLGLVISNYIDFTFPSDLNTLIGQLKEAKNKNKSKRLGNMEERKNKLYMEHFVLFF